MTEPVPVLPATRASRIQLLTVREYLDRPDEPIPWLVEPILPAGGQMLLYSDPKVGKSHAALQLCFALLGEIPDWLGFTATPIRRPIVYLGLDGSPQVWKLTFQKLEDAGFGEAWKKVHFVDRRTMGYWPFNILDPLQAQDLHAELSTLNPAVIIVDTLRKLHTLKENDPTESTIVLNALMAVTQPAALVVISHARKGHHDRPADLRADHRGANQVVADVDTIIRFNLTKGNRQKGSMHLVGRVMDERILKLTKDPLTHLWAPDHQEVEGHIAAVMADPTLGSLRLKARALQDRLGRSEEACRSLLRRLEARPGGRPTPADGLKLVGGKDLHGPAPETRSLPVTLKE